MTGSLEGISCLVKEGYKISGGYLIVFPHKGKERTVETSDHLSKDIKNLRGEYGFKDELGSFVKKIRDARLKNKEIKLDKREIRELADYFNLDFNKITPDIYWQLAKAVVAKEGSGVYYLANTTRNIFIRDNNILVLEGIVGDSDIIALAQYHYSTFEEALNAQLDIEKVVEQIKLYEHHKEYALGDFSNLPK